jgi:hypothetical protein
MRLEKYIFAVAMFAVVNFTACSNKEQLKFNKQKKERVNRSSFSLPNPAEDVSRCYIKPKIGRDSLSATN